MSIQKRRSVLERAKNSWDRAYSECATLAEELAVRELAAYEGENYCEAFVLQFSFIEHRIEDAISHFAKTARVHSSSAKSLKNTWKVSDKITYFDCLLAPRIEKRSRKDFERLIESLREYNTFRNDYLHDCANTNKFTSAIHVDQALEEAYNDGLKIMRLLTKVKLAKSGKHELE